MTDLPSALSDSERFALLCLHLAPELGPKRIAALLDHFPSAEAILLASSQSLQEVSGIGPQLAAKLANSRGQLQQLAERELDWLGTHQGQLLCRGDANYPAEFYALADAPICLFYRGQLPPAASVAIVGTRACTAYGKRQTQRFVHDLAARGFSIASGLARGIDTEAHRTALQAGAHTTAIIGSGMGDLYPAENIPLAEEIIQSGGALISEYPHRQPPHASNFPRRNRLVAALALGTLVIESSLKGGSLITARLAAECGRQVYALPGPVDRPASAGCHALIRDGVQLVTSAQDIIEDLAWSTPTNQHQPQTQTQSSQASTQPKNQKSTPKLDHLDPEQIQLYQLLQGNELSLDELIEQSQLQASQVSTHLLQLELYGLIAQAAGQRYHQV